MKRITPVAFRSALCLRRFCTSPSLSPTEAYNALADAGKITKDIRQQICLDHLDRVYYQILERENKDKQQNPQPGKKSFFSSFFSSQQPETIQTKKFIQSCYLYGGVGCGKTFLMDLFYDSLPKTKRIRTHFHSFMLEVHERLHKQRSNKGEVEVAALAKTLIEEKGEIICFDEMNVTDIGDAVILRLLLEHLMNNNAVIIFTSNRHPDDLYKNGLQRNLFLPCIELINKKSVIHNMESTIDYRLLSTTETSTYLHPLTEENGRKLDGFFRSLTKGITPKQVSLITQGRKVRVPSCASGVAEFHFNDLCDSHVGTADYYAISKAFHTIILRGVPIMNLEMLTQVRRFINLIDIFYDHKVKVICTAEADPFHLFQPNEATQDDVLFAFDRCASRLQDMQSLEYKKGMHSPPGLDNQELLLGDITLGTINEIWNKYDADRNDTLEPHELQLLLEDIREQKMGHRSVSLAELDEAMKIMDEDGNGSVSREEFEDYFKKAGLGVWYI